MDNLQNKVAITISGADKVGIVAKITNVLAGQRVNIKDIKQTLLQEHFIMFLQAEINDPNISIDEIEKSLISVGEEFGVDIKIQQKQNSFDVHTVQ